MNAACRRIEDHTGHVLHRREFTQWFRRPGRYLTLFRRPDASIIRVEGHGPITVTYIAGYAEGGAPAWLTKAIAALAEYYAAVPSAIGKGWDPLPAEVEALCAHGRMA